jgi:type I restriction enzyme M protein
VFIEGSALESVSEPTSWCWIAPGSLRAAMAADLTELESRLWDAADELRANSSLKASEYGPPVLGLIFLRFADAKFAAARDAIEARDPRVGRSARLITARSAFCI